jgi:hypothetical protein
MRPRIGIKVQRGLNELAGFVDAGSCEDILGYSQDQLKRLSDREGLRRWKDIQAACEWIRRGSSMDTVSQEHLCNYEGFGALGDVCGACEAERTEVRGGRMNAYAPSRKYRRTPYGEELILEYRLLPVLARHGITVEKDATGMVWRVCRGDRFLTDGVSSLTDAIYQAVRAALCGEAL